MDYRVSQKMYLTLTLYFEAVTKIISGISNFPVSPDMYNLFDTLLIYFHDLPNGGDRLYFPHLKFLKSGILQNFCREIRTCCFQVRFGTLSVGPRHSVSHITL